MIDDFLISILMIYRKKARISLKKHLNDFKKL